MAYIFIYVIVSTAIFLAILFVVKTGKSTINEYKNSRKVRTAFINIFLLASDNKINSFNVNGNEIYLEGEEGNFEILNIIRNKDGKLTVSYYIKYNGYYERRKENTAILDNVDDFNVIKRGGILCIEIKRNGESFIKFL